MTLYLVTANVYGSIEAPKSRGFSFIEIWMVGIQSTMLVAIFEYGLVLVLLRRDKKTSHVVQVQPMGQKSLRRKSTMDVEQLIKMMDKWTFLFSILFFFIFNFFYWKLALLF